MKHFLSKIFFFYLLVFSINVIAQEQIPEKYRNIDDTISISKVLSASEKFRYTEPDSFIFYIEIAEQLSQEMNSKLHLIKSLIAKGGYYFRKGESQKALDVYITSKQLALEMNREDYINESNIGISAAYLLLAYYPLAEKHLIDALEYYEKTKNDKGIGDACLNMTFIKLEQKDYEHAKVYGELAYKHYLACDYKIGVARALSNLCDINMYLGNLPDALEYGSKALHYTKLSNQLSLNCLIYQNIGGVYLAQNQLDSAQYYYALSISEAKNWGDSFVVCRSKFGIAEVYAIQNQFEKALSISLESFELAHRANLIQLKGEAANKIALYYSKAGDYKKAFEYKMISSDINDSLFNKEKYKVQNELEAIYQSQKKEETISNLSREKEIEILKNRQSLYYISGLIILLIILTMSGILLYSNSKISSQRKTIELEQRLLRSQMNPHFIFNAISCIQEFIMAKNPLEASSYLSNFAKLMRSILNNSSKEFITLNEEIETLDHYLRLQKLRFSGKMEYEIKVDDNLDIEELIIPPMLAQPFIENAVNYGVAKMEEGIGNVFVEFSQDENNLILSITDNGPGINPDDDKNDKTHQSMATQITQRRIDNYKKSYKRKVQFKLNNLLSENTEYKGFQVVFNLPKIYKS